MYELRSSEAEQVGDWARARRRGPWVEDDDEEDEEIEAWDDDESGVTRPRRLPYVGATVMVTGSAGHFSSVTGADGSFEIHAPVGEYDVTVEVAPGRYGGAGFPHVTLPDPGACAESDIFVHSDGHISGRVIDADRRPVAGLTVEAGADAAVNQPFFAPRYRARTAADGTFTISELPPGPYAVGFNMRRVSGYGLYPRVLYSSNNDASPSVIALAAGAHVAIGDFVVPAAIGIARVTGLVDRDDHEPVAGVKVFLEVDDPQSMTLVGEPAVVDARGAFAIAVLPGYRYRVFAESEVTDPASGNPRIIRSDVVVVTGVRDAPPLLLTLKAAR